MEGTFRRQSNVLAFYVLGASPIRLDSNRSVVIRAWLIYYRGVNIEGIHTDVFAIKFDHDYAISLEGGGAAVD